MSTYASKTTVTADRSIDEIRQVLRRYNAKSFAMAEDENRVGIGFEMCQRRVRFVMPLPDSNAAEYQFTPATNKRRSPDSARQAYEQAVRQRYRALLLTIKAKLESVESKIESFEEAFMAQIVLPDGRTMSEVAVPQIQIAYDTDTMPPLLGSGD